MRERSSPSEAETYRQLFAPNYVIKDNAMESAALAQLIVDRGGHTGVVVVKDNLGSLFVPA